VIAPAPFVLEKAPMGIGLLLGLWAMGLAGGWLWFGLGSARRGEASRLQRRERRLAGASLMFVSVLFTVFAFTGGFRVTVSCETGRIDVDQRSPIWPGAWSYPEAQVREVAGGVEPPSQGDQGSPQKVLVLVMKNGEQHVLSNGPWKEYGSNERAVVALTAALARCGPPSKAK
jgi:hypothetical protein